MLDMTLFLCLYHTPSMCPLKKNPVNKMRNGRFLKKKLFVYIAACGTGVSVCNWFSKGLEY